MDPRRYQRVRELYHAASEYEGPAREAFLEGACAGDPSLLGEVRRLLSSPAGSTWDVLPEAGAVPDQDPFAAGTRIGDYVVERLLGAGGMGRVYAVRDAKGERVALKVFHPHLLHREGARKRFVREAEVGRRVAHENVVRTLGAGRAVVDGQGFDFLVMEYVQGRTLREILEDLGSLPEGLLREIAIQASEGLAAIHEQGVVHRDVKPENLLLTADDRLRITDLGVARLLEDVSRLTGEGQFVGSLPYAAPEQIAGRTVSPTTDLYALGVVLHEMATGTNPFEADSPVAVLKAHLESTPRPIVEAGRGVSPFFSAVVETLLAKEPDARFADAATLARVLRESETGRWWIDRATSGRGTRRPLVPVRREAALRGRKEELEALQSAWHDAREGRGRVVFVRGEAGLGKTRLVSELLAAHGEEDAAILYGAYEPGGASGGLRSALARYFGNEGVERSLERTLGESSALIPALAAWLRLELPPTGEPAIDLATRNALAGRLLHGMAAVRPVLWVVEDLQHASSDSLATVLALARTVAKQPVLFLLTSREALPPTIRAGLEHQEGTASILLERLAGADVDALCQERFADEDAGRRIAAQVAPLADGVPLFALEILRGLESEGRLGRDTDGRYVELRSVRRVAVPPTLREIVEGRLRGLTREEAETLDVAAVGGLELEPELIARVRGVTRLRVLEVLGHLERGAGLVRSDGARLRFDHPLVQEVVYEALPPALRAELHRSLGEAILDRGGGAEKLRGPALVAAFLHLLRGSQPAAALALARRGLDQLENVQRGPALVDALRRLGDLEETPPRDRVRYVTRLGRALQRLGQTSEAGEVLTRAQSDADRLGDGRLAAGTRSALGYLDLERGRFAAALRLFDEGIALLGTSEDPALRADLLGGRGQAYWCLGRYEDARRCHEEALEIGRSVPLPHYEARASSDLAIVCHELGELDEAESLLRRAIELQRGEGALRNIPVSTTNLGNVLHDQGRKGEALACYESSLSFCRQYAFRESEAVALVNLGEVRMRLGDFGQAERDFRLCLRITQEMGARRVEGYGHHGLGLLHVLRGDLDAAEEELGRALALRRDIQNRPTIGDTLLALGQVAQERGDDDRARERLEEALAIADEVGDVQTATLATIRLALLGARTAQDAEQVFGRARARLRHDTAAEARWLLWRVTETPAYLAEAGALLAHERAAAPPGSAERMKELVPLHRAVEAARA